MSSDSEENIWSALLETGYLTKAVKERMSLLPLRISDQGVRLAFRQDVWSDFREAKSVMYLWMDKRVKIVT